MHDAPVPRRTLLVGYGKLGARLAPRLREGGGEVIALRRGRGALPEGVSGVSLDLSTVPTVTLPEVDAMIVTLPPSGVLGGYRAALANLAAALPATPRRTVFVSSTGVFDGASSDRPLSEGDEPVPTTERSRGLYDGERVAIELFDAVIVRPAGIYGPGRDFLLRKVREGALLNHRRRTNRIHETDLVRALDLLVRTDDPPRLVHAVDAAPAPLGDVVGFIAGALGIDVPPDDTGQAASGAVYDGALLASLLGRLEYPTYREGYAAMISAAAAPRTLGG